MRRGLRAMAVYFGFVDDERTPPLRMLRRDLLARGAEAALYSSAGTAFAYGVLDWQTTPLFIVAGAIVGAVALYLSGTNALPERPPASPPADAEWATFGARRALGVAAGVLSLLLLVLSSDSEPEFRSAGAAFLGALAGFSAEAFLRVWQVRRWERDHGQRLAIRRGEEQEQFAVNPLPR